MKNLISIILILLPFIGLSQWNSLGNIMEGEAEGDRFGWSTALNDLGDVLIAGAPDNTNTAIAAGHARVYFWDGNDWIQRGEDIDGTEENDNSGSYVAIDGSGNRIAICATNGNNSTSGLNAGTVKIYDWNGSNWNQTGNTLEGIGDPVLGSDWFGRALSFSSDGNTLAVGSPFNNNVNGNSAGLAKIFQWNGNDWTQIGSDILGAENRDDFGWSIDINQSGTIVAIGAKASFPFGPNDFGYVDIYEWVGNDWVQRGNSLIGEFGGDEFGRTVSFNDTGNILAIGAPGYEIPTNVECSAYIFEWDGTNYIQLGNTLKSGIDADDFGRAISINADGDLLAIGSGNFFSNGFVSIFKWIDTDWVLQQTLEGQNLSDIFGCSVSFNSIGNRLSVGAWGQENGTTTVFKNDQISNNANIETTNLNYHPNPTTNQIYLSASENIESVRLYDGIGRKLKFIKGVNNQLEIDLSTFKSGIYFLDIQYKRNRKTIKVIKN